MVRCSLILSNMKKYFGFHEWGPNGLSNFGCLPWKYWKCHQNQKQNTFWIPLPFEYPTTEITKSNLHVKSIPADFPKTLARMRSSASKVLASLAVNEQINFLAQSSPSFKLASRMALEIVSSKVSGSSSTERP